MLRILLLVSLALFPTASFAESDFYNRNSGAWRGVGVQDDGRNWAIELSVSSLLITVAYPSIPCGGVWVKHSSNRDRLLASEQIKTGLDLCIDGSFVVLEARNTTLIARWYDASATVYALAVLQRNNPAISGYDAQLATTLNAIKKAQAIDPPSTAMVRQLFGF